MSSALFNTFCMGQFAVFLGTVLLWALELTGVLK